MKVFVEQPWLDRVYYLGNNFFKFASSTQFRSPSTFKIPKCGFWLQTQEPTSFPRLKDPSTAGPGLPGPQIEGLEGPQLGGFGGSESWGLGEPLQLGVPQPLQTSTLKRAFSRWKDHRPTFNEMHSEDQSICPRYRWLQFELPCINLNQIKKIKKS